MSNLIVTCRAKKRTCRVVYPSLAKCVGCKYSDISRERYKEAKEKAWNGGKVTHESSRD